MSPQTPANLSASPGEVRGDHEIQSDDALLTIVGRGSRVLGVNPWVALEGALFECYACMVGVWTGPESHDEHCSRRGGSAPEVVHTVRTEIAKDRAYWECSCGRSGSCCAETRDVDVASDRHIDYDAGHRRVNSSLPLDEPWGA